MSQSVEKHLPKQEWHKDELSPNQLSTVRAFYHRTQELDLTEWTSDTFRQQGYDIYLASNMEIGTVFGLIKRFHWARQIGEKPSEIVSSHSRKIDILEWTERGKEVLSR